MLLKYVMTNVQYGTQLWGGYKCLHTKPATFIKTTLLPIKRCVILFV